MSPRMLTSRRNESGDYIVWPFFKWYMLNVIRALSDVTRSAILLVSAVFYMLYEFEAVCRPALSNIIYKTFTTFWWGIVLSTSEVRFKKEKIIITHFHHFKYCRNRDPNPWTREIFRSCYDSLSLFLWYFIVFWYCFFIQNEDKHPVHAITGSRTHPSIRGALQKL